MKVLETSLAISIVILLAGCGSPNDAPSAPDLLDLTIGVSTSAQVMAEMGREPDRYSWEGTEYTSETLPNATYCMTYRKGVITAMAFIIDNSAGGQLLREVRIGRAGTEYYCLSGSLRIGTTLEDALAALGAPVSTLDGVANAGAEKAAKD